MYLQKARIYNKLLELAQVGKFYLATYNADGTLVENYTTDKEVSPKTISINEVTSDFDTPVNFRRYARRERSNWTWQLFLAFDKEVIVERFEKEIIANALILPYDKTHNLQQVTLNLVDVEYTHPVKREPAAGTQASFTFQAALGPI
jgi:hypothetical protein